MRSGSPRVEFEDVRIKKVTDLAMKCRILGEDYWIPKSHIDLDDSEVAEESDVGKLVVSEWIATEKGLV